MPDGVSLTNTMAFWKRERAVKQTKKPNERPSLIMRGNRKSGGEGTINERSVESHTLQGTVHNL